MRRKEPLKYGDDIVESYPYNIIEVNLRDEPYSSAMPGYAYASGSRVITLKTGVLVGLDRNGPSVKTPGVTLSLMYMVHEVTAHRFDKNFRHLGGDTKDLREHATHYDSQEAHCESSKRGQNKCLNGYIMPAFANAKNALPFFEKWYNDHKDDKLTMFNPTAAKPAKPKTSQEKEKTRPSRSLEDR